MDKFFEVGFYFVFELFQVLFYHKNQLEIYDFLMKNLYLEAGLFVLFEMLNNLNI